MYSRSSPVSTTPRYHHYQPSPPLPEENVPHPFPKAFPNPFNSPMVSWFGRSRSSGSSSPENISRSKPRKSVHAPNALVGRARRTRPAPMQSVGRTLSFVQPRTNCRPHESCHLFHHFLPVGHVYECPAPERNCRKGTRCVRVEK